MKLIPVRDLTDTVLIKRYYPDSSIKTERYVLAKDTSYRHGPYVKYYPDGQIKAKGNYRHNKPHGKITMYYKGGNIELEGYLEDGVITLINVYHENGNFMKTEKYLDGLLHGEVKVYNEDSILNITQYWDMGKIVKVIFYRDEKISGIFKYEEAFDSHPSTIISYFSKSEAGKDGVISEKTSYDEEKRYHGEFVSYYPNGNIKYRSEYIHGKRDGVWKYFNEEGELTKTEKWNEGEKVSEENY